MKPYYEDGRITIYHGDAREILPMLRADVIIADPPYGQTSLAWDKWPDGWPGCAAGTLSGRGSMWCFGSLRMFMKHTDDFSLWTLAQDLVWEKQNGSNFHNDRFRRVHESVCQFYPTSTRWSDVYRSPVFTQDATGRTVRRKSRPPHMGEISVGDYVSRDGGPRLMRSVQYMKSTHGFAVHPTQKPVGIILPLLAVTALVMWPTITGRIATRESAFTILKAVALASSLNILLGYTGYVSFGHIVFYGFGGYIGFYLFGEQEWPLSAAILAGGLASGMLAYLLGTAILRLRGAYFALATIGVNAAMQALINNLDLLGGPTGMTLDFKAYLAFGSAARALQMSFYVLAALAFLAILLSHLVRVSKFGLALQAIRENEDAAEVMGVVAPQVKTWAYVLSALVPGMVGVLFFFKNGNIEPHDAFPLHASIELLVMVMLGGQGSVLGPILGAFAYQGMRGYLVTSPIFKDIQLSVAGLVLLLIVLFIPAGAIGWLRRRMVAWRRVLA